MHAFRPLCVPFRLLFCSNLEVWVMMRKIITFYPHILNNLTLLVMNGVLLTQKLISFVMNLPFYQLRVPFRLMIMKYLFLEGIMRIILLQIFLLFLMLMKIILIVSIISLYLSLRVSGITIQWFFRAICLLCKMFRRKIQIIVSKMKGKYSFFRIRCGMC
jgi:hypothetical protein